MVAYTSTYCIFMIMEGLPLLSSGGGHREWSVYANAMIIKCSCNLTFMYYDVSPLRNPTQMFECYVEYIRPQDERGESVQAHPLVFQSLFLVNMCSTC